MKARVAVALLCIPNFMIVPSAWATDANLWMELGTVIGSEAYCGLTYDQNAIKAFIEEHVSPNDMEFIGDLDMRVSLVEHDTQSMSASQKTAHCAQIVRVAKTYGFVK